MRESQGLEEKASAEVRAPGQDRSAPAQEGGGAGAVVPMLGAFSEGGVRGVAEAGVGGAGEALPHKAQVQASFGHHDLGEFKAHVGGAAGEAADAMGANAYALGESAAFGQSPDLHTAAHEYAHLVQQKAGAAPHGGVGAAGDALEQHADAVADRVVAGQSAEGLLDEVGAGEGAGQARAVQMDIKSDLNGYMDGWGTDENAIFRRLGRATPPELNAVLNDARLMARLRGELDGGDMSRVLDLAQAPLEQKLRLAMDGWGTDEGYIQRSLLRASAADLQRVAGNAALVNRLQDELSGEDLRRVFERLPLPLERRLQMAMDGWGTDEDYIRRSLERASAADLQRVAQNRALVARLRDELSGDDIRGVLDRLSLPLAQKLDYAVDGWGTDEGYIWTSVEGAAINEVVAVAQNRALLRRVDGDLSGEDLSRWRGLLARRIYLEAGDPLLAFQMCMGSKGQRQERLDHIGALDQQRALLDTVISTSTVGAEVIQAFETYWDVDTDEVSGATAWQPATIQAIHAAMKNLPDQDTRNGVWERLTLTGDPDLINRAAWNGSDLIVGANITPATAGTQTYGHGTLLAQDALTGSLTLKVTEPARFSVGDTVALDRSGANRDVGAITGIAGDTYTLDTALTHDHFQNDAVTPDDNTALHEVAYIDATVRHEIGHAVETAIGGVTGFTQGLGGWWTGDDFETWANAMGNPWQTNDGTVLTDQEKRKIKNALEDAVGDAQEGGGVNLQAREAADHPINTHWGKQIPVVVAADACLQAGGGFTNNANAIYAASGKRFSISSWYKRFMYHNENVVAERVSNYSLFAPAEFFAETYTLFYEEAGQAGVTEADYGRLIRNTTWRNWIRTNIHNRGMAPAGGAGGGGPAQGAATGKHAGNPGR
jgi:hypothetical protein